MDIINITHQSAKKITNQDSALTQERPREIMGENFFGVEEAIKHFGVNPSKRELASLADVPFSEKTLTLCKYTHALVAVFPLSIVDIRDRVDHNVFYCRQFSTHKEAWYNKQAFAKDCGEIGWHLVRTNAVPDSTEKTWWQQQQMLVGMNEKTPTARVLVYTMAGHFLSTRERLFIYLYYSNVRCSDHVSEGYVVVSGYDQPTGIFGIAMSNIYPGYVRSRTLGVASERNAEY